MEQRTALQWNMGLGQGARATIVFTFHSVDYFTGNLNLVWSLNRAKM